MKGYLVSLRHWLASLRSSLNDEWLTAMSPSPGLHPHGPGMAPEGSNRTHMAQRKLGLEGPSAKDTAGVSGQAFLSLGPWRVGQDAPDLWAGDGGLDQMNPHTDAASPHISTQNCEGQKHNNLCTGELCIFWHLYIGKPVRQRFTHSMPFKSHTEFTGRNVDSGVIFCP